MASLALSFLLLMGDNNSPYNTSNSQLSEIIDIKDFSQYLCRISVNCYHQHCHRHHGTVPSGHSLSLLPPHHLSHQAQNPLLFYSPKPLNTCQHQGLFPPPEILFPIVPGSSPGQVLPVLQVLAHSDRSLPQRGLL